MTIKFYKTNAPYGFMNNFYPARFFVYNRWWNTIEHAYQAQKCSDPTEYDAIHQAASPRKARDLGQKVKMRDHWDEILKDRVMEECVRAKFLQHPNLRKQLMDTGDEELIENSKIDAYWGCGVDGKGRNQLGKTLMKIRFELKGE